MAIANWKITRLVPFNPVDKKTLAEVRCAVLHCAVLSFTALCCAMLRDDVLRCAADAAARA